MIELGARIRMRLQGQKVAILACPFLYKGRAQNNEKPTKEVASMSNMIDKFPEKTRWEVATHSLTGAFTAISRAYAEALGQDGFDKFNGPLWNQAGKGAKEFAASAGLAAESAPDIEAITHLMAQVSMGPEFVFNIVESTKDRCVGTTTECPWHKRWKEQGMGFDCCSAGHQAWGDGAVESLNPDFTFKLTRNMVRGDAHCEWVVERKK
jgi:hypothetical protein